MAVQSAKVGPARIYKCTSVVHDRKTSGCLLNIIIIPGLGEHGHAWYINGELAPDLYLAKGIQYTFIVEVGYTVHIHSGGRLYSTHS